MNQEEMTVALPRYRSFGFYVVTVFSLILAIIAGIIVRHIINVTKLVNVYDASDNHYIYQYQCVSAPAPGEEPRWEFEETNANWPEHAVLERTDGDSTVWTLRTSRDNGAKTKTHETVRTDAPDGTSVYTYDGKEQGYASIPVKNINNVVAAVERLNQTAGRPAGLLGFLTAVGVLALGQLFWFLRWKKACRYAAAEEE